MKIKSPELYSNQLFNPNLYELRAILIKRLKLILTLPLMLLERELEAFTESSDFIN